jgi:hypothetical protein
VQGPDYHGQVNKEYMFFSFSSLIYNFLFEKSYVSTSLGTVMFRYLVVPVDIPAYSTLRFYLIRRKLFFCFVSVRYLNCKVVKSAYPDLVGPFLLLISDSELGLIKGQ